VLRDRVARLTERVADPLVSAVALHGIKRQLAIQKALLAKELARHSRK
jgi:hypothetical protein